MGGRQRWRRPVRADRARCRVGHGRRATAVRVGYERELLGGNGILLENRVGRFVADAEAIYSYDGTREINTLIVGRAITGLGAFV
jgi:alkylation response protein AidB-like acyl-CoA dehydrogenase